MDDLYKQKGIPSLQTVKKLDFIFFKGVEGIGKGRVIPIPSVPVWVFGPIGKVV